MVMTSKEESALNHESSSQDMMKFHAEVAREIKNLFQPFVLFVMHWDGKMVLTTKGSAADKVDRLTILVSGCTATGSPTLSQRHWTSYG